MAATNATTMIHVRIDQDLKERASATFEAMGLSLSEAVRVFLTRSAKDQAIPFALKVPNPETIAAMLEAERGDVFRSNTVAEMMAKLNADD